MALCLFLDEHVQILFNLPRNPWAFVASPFALVPRETVNKEVI